MDGRILQEERGSQYLPSIPDSEPSIRRVFAAITSCKSTLNTLNSHMSDFKMDRSLLRQGMHQFDARLKTAEERISSEKDHIPGLS